MGVKPPRAIGEFAWFRADIAVECGACRRVQVYCDFEALDRLRERGWSIGLADATKRFRCRCGSRNVRLRPIGIFMRPRPIPTRPAALLPIYAEEARSLFRRAPIEFPDKAAV